MTEPTGNPYAAPDPSTDYSAGAEFLSSDFDKVNQVTIVGILQIVLGILELAIGGMLLLAGVFMSYAFTQMDDAAGEPPPVAFQYGMQAYYFVVGALAMIFSLVRIGAGVGSFWFRGRAWMLISLIGGMVTSLTCYCAPFSIGLAIYGLIVMFSPGVIKAYQLGAQGVSPGAIKHRFISAAYGQPLRSQEMRE